MKFTTRLIPVCLALTIGLIGFSSGAANLGSRENVAPVVTQDQPTIIKDSVVLWAYQIQSYRGDFNTWAWVPRIEFRVNGPIPSGGQLYVEAGMPGTPSWVKFDCDTGQIEKGYWWKTNCGGNTIPEDKGSTYTGPVNFAIKMRNELMGSDSTLFTGKMKVLKIHSNEVGPRAVNRFVFYVDHDWTLPIGYAFVDVERDRKKPVLNVSFWVRGRPYKIEPYLFYQGKEISRVMLNGMLMGTPGCDFKDETGTMHAVDDDKKIIWNRVTCGYYVVLGWNDDDPERTDLHLLSKNPGEYEVKILWNNKLARSIKFTVRPDGKFDNGIATANKLGNDRVIVPVQIVGDQDGAWDKNTWKTDAFFGNPLTGFTWP